MILTALKIPGGEILELGRRVLHPSYRGGHAMQPALGGACILCGAPRDRDPFRRGKDFTGTQADALAEPLSLPAPRYLAPPNCGHGLWPKARQKMEPDSPRIAEPSTGDGKMPSLIKAYLRLGGCVGEGPYPIHDF